MRIIHALLNVLLPATGQRRAGTTTAPITPCSLARQRARMRHHRGAALPGGGL
ncbi:hypothetical protein J7I94_07925 [Streptomyces sp. ISL-12]|uniref:hypothetical protein n=1 Tax=Streptomyces sp. ISL-12 TaxID=2819177 RepID=UPI001BE9FC68|nr:hypothetical protein [Streptomyces sp. ISL-12]MBT2410487.1 hypothetical protein [Streptomyces sp. ISL-12]